MVGFSVKKYDKPMPNPVKTIQKMLNTPQKPSENPDKTLVRNVGGRPRKDADADKKKKIDNYFLQENTTKTISGIGRYLGYSGALEFITEAKKTGGYLAYALSKVEENYEINLLGKNSTGAIFALKQLGWKDTQSVETESKSVNVQITLTASLDDVMSRLSPVEEQKIV